MLASGSFDYGKFLSTVTVTVHCPSDFDYELKHLLICMTQARNNAAKAMRLMS